MKNPLDEIFSKLPVGYQGIESFVECQDCKKDFSLKIAKVDDQYAYSGGAIYEPPRQGIHFKCDDCYDKNPDFVGRKINECEVYSRVVGYLRPIKQWNDGKVAEFGKRVMYKPELDMK